MVIGLAASPGPARAGAVRSELCPATPARFELLSLPAPSLERSKRIWVYLPPGYDCAAPRRYPVFYFNDGQDLFDWNPFAAELGPALAADIAAREGLVRQLAAGGPARPCCRRGQAAAHDRGRHRLRRRAAQSRPCARALARLGEGRGIQYGEFVARTVVGAVDRRYRTVAARRCRGIGGASLGGISALQIGLAHPARFGMVLSFSPVLSDPALAGFIAGAWRSASGSARSAYLVDFDDDARGSRDRGWLAAVVTAAKSFRRHAVLVQTPAGRHAIGSWASRAVPGLEVLFAAQCSRTRPRGFNVQP